jgi:hypothetical protein
MSCQALPQKDSEGTKRSKMTKIGGNQNEKVMCSAAAVQPLLIKRIKMISHRNKSFARSSIIEFFVNGLSMG